MSTSSEDRRSDAPGRRDRKRLDEVFGVVLPDTTSDERGTGAESDDMDRWYLENRPPHHDR